MWKIKRRCMYVIYRRCPRSLREKKTLKNQSDRQILSVTISYERTRDISRRGFKGKQPETVLKEKHGIWDLKPELTITHLISKSTPKSAIQYPSLKVKRWSGKDLSYWLSIFVSAATVISKTSNRKRESMEKWEGRGESSPYVVMSGFG